ncbi:peroxisomal membrane protein PEX14 isoform X5 [Setaria italica]|uniref:peroxisomal membrane protein PEX14 isoform X5 n=1 Tax=Setaria italica TaxID=4555 RepID=UPI00064687A5|nr:peroxisomal membrane protein PEX14 isoform X5 [Setaria italica]
MASTTGSGQQQSPSPAAADADPGAGAEKLVFEAPPQPVREDYVQNAVKFLSHPKVKGSPVVYRRSFLEKKGLTTQEIDEAFRRVPDPQPSATTATASQPQQQANSQNQSTGVQTYAPVQSVLPGTAGPVVLRTQPRFSWYQAFLAAGLLLGFGASAAVFIKKLFIPRLKSWIRSVVAEGDEIQGNQPKAKIDEETAEAVKASASAVSAIAKTNQQLLASKDEEKKILSTLTQALDSQARELKSLSESLNHSRESINITREDRFSQYRPLEEHAPPAIRNGPVNSSWRASQQTNMYGASNGDFGSGWRSSFAPAPIEPTAGSFSRSCFEQTMSTAQRGDRSSGSKPWEMQQYSQQRPGYGSNSQLSDDGSYTDAQDNYPPSYHQNGKAPDFQADEPRPLTYNTGIEERPPPQRRWMPPQPPGVVMPEAAAAIRQPKTLPKQPSSDASEAAGEMQVNGASSASAVVTEVPVNGAGASDAGRSEIEEQSVTI